MRQQWVPPAGIRVARNSFWLAVESIASPGNLGTIIRTAEAAGVSGIFVLDGDSDPYDPAAVRAYGIVVFAKTDKMSAPRLHKLGTVLRSGGRGFVAIRIAGL